MRREVADDVVDTIPSWRYLDLQLFIGQRGEELIEASNLRFQVLIAIAAKISSLVTCSCFRGCQTLIRWV